MRRPAQYLALVGVVSLPASAYAASFDDDGTFSFDPHAAVTVDFDDDIIPDGTEMSLTVEDAGALSGTRVLQLPPYQGVDVPVAVPDGATNYRVSAWVRGAETVVDVEIRYADNPHDGVDEIALLYPTGRMTSDGWVEVENDHVRVDTDRGPSVGVGFFSITGSAVDAVEITPTASLLMGERSGKACNGSGDPICGDQQVCAFSQCRYVGGRVPDLPANRDEVTEYLGSRMRLLFGPLLNREVDLPNSELALERMMSAETPWAYWNSFMLAVRRLHDGHTSTSGIADFVLQNERPIGVCFIEGDADMSHGVAPQDSFYLDVLVSHVSQYRNFMLKPGDRVTLVDGQHPIAWARAQTEHHWGMNPTSNHSTFAEVAEQLRSLIAAYAHTMTVVRCDSGTSTCAAPETIDLSAVPSLAADEVFESVACDNRPLRHLPDSPANHAGGGDSVYFGVVNESNVAERIYGAEWESLYTTTGSDGVAVGLKAAITQFKADANAVIFDHRSGNGGTNLGSSIVWNFAVPQRPISTYFDREHIEDEQPDTVVGLQLFQRGVDHGYADFAGSTSPTTVPVALLITRDVSASDWLPLGMKAAASNVKIFGPFQTNGGFSTRYGFGYWLGLNYVIAVGDTFDASGLSRNGRGVEPDVVVLPKQSDLLTGRDTVFDAALAWARGELGQ